MRKCRALLSSSPRSGSGGVRLERRPHPRGGPRRSRSALLRIACLGRAAELECPAEPGPGKSSPPSPQSVQQIVHSSSHESTSSLGRCGTTFGTTSENIRRTTYVTTPGTI